MVFRIIRINNSEAHNEWIIYSVSWYVKNILKYMLDKCAQHI